MTRQQRRAAYERERITEAFKTFALRMAIANVCIGWVGLVAFAIALLLRL